MSEPKAQLVDPQGNMNLPGMNATGVITASSFSGAGGVVTGLTGSPNLNVGVVTATSFVGDGTGHAANLTGTPNLNLGLTTATSFVGDAVGKAAGLTGTPNLNVGLITATGFTADVKGNVTGNVSGNVTGDITGNVVGNITGIAGSVTQGKNIHVGVATATTLYGDGSNMTGIAATNFNTQTVTANSGSTAIDLSAGNMIKLVQSAATTISFANTSTTQYLTIIRDNGSGDITWPESVKWDGGSPPIPTSASESNDYQALNLITRDTGLTWYGWQDVSSVGGLSTLSWGGNFYGSLGLNDTVNRSSPTQLGAKITSSSAIRWSKAAYAGGRFYYGTSATKTDGSLWAWGYQLSSPLNGQFPASSSVSSPVQVVGSAGNLYRHLYYIYKGMIGHRQNNTAYAWGVNEGGSLGQNQAPAQLSGASSPMQIPGGWHEFASGSSTWGIKYNYSAPSPYRGTLWGWGSFYSGSLGLNQSNIPVVYLSSPTQVPGTNWHRIQAGGYANVAVKTDGSLWSWGGQNDSDYGGRGSLGQNNLLAYSSPTQIGTDTNWGKDQTSFVMTYKWVANIKTDGTLWTWGGNQYGNSAQNNKTHYSSPTQVGTDTNWSEIAAAGGLACFGKKTDGTMWGWGYGGDGGLGLNDVAYRSSPHQLPGSWDMMSGGITLTNTGVMVKKEF